MTVKNGEDRPDLDRICIVTEAAAQTQKPNIYWNKNDSFLGSDTLWVLTSGCDNSEC